jgi:hypothetical protein
MTPQEALGTYFLLSSLGSKTDIPDFLATVYPVRSQIVTFAIIGFRRDRGLWPSNESELIAYAAETPANPPLPKGATTGLVVQTKEDGGITYSTLEDRQRGREFFVSVEYKVAFTVPSYVYASATSPTAPANKASTVEFDWGKAITDALVKIATAGK